MKNLILILSLVSLLSFFGCNSYKASSGPVIKTAGEDSGLNRVVTFTVTGKGIEPESALTKGQARLMAERAAVADGYRQFVEKLRGVYVEAMMSAGYGSVNEEFIQTRTRALLRGVQINEITHGQYGIAAAEMTLRVNFSRQGMIWWPEGLGDKLAYGHSAGSESVQK
jgi:hypothetical protein